MAMNWSEEQLKAINDCGHNILVSAGAGSGKTAVLTERIYQLVKKGYPITRFLVLTFTNAAAMEMKSRVRGKILEDSNLSHFAPDIENAHIETFDAFCLFLAKKYAAYLNISPSIVVINQTILEIQESKIIDNIFENWYEKNDPIFNEMVVKYSIKNDERLKTLVKDILKLANLQLDKEKFYKEFDSKYLTDEFINKQIEEEFENSHKTLLFLRKKCDELQDLKTYELFSEIIDYALSAKNYDELKELLSNKERTNFSKKRTPADSLKDYIKEVFKKVSSDYGDSKFIHDTFNENKKYASLLVEITKEVDDELVKFQNEHNAYSFADIAKMAIKLVRNDEICKEISSLFDFIMVDEYQDTSDIQEEVITRLSNNNLYMVGDVKQSIYRFRNANCNIFNVKFEQYKMGNGGEEIDLNKSFRSREQIVDAVNDIFGQLMIKENNVIDYKNGHNFEFGNKGYSSKEQENIDYSVDIASYSLEENENSFQKEMDIISSDIIRKINSGYKVVDGSDFRECKFKDFAIIIDRKTKFDDIKKYFSEKNIPINAIQEESLNSSEITYVTKNLIKLFYCVKNNDYEVDFKHAYVSIARSFLVCEKDRDIYRHIKLSALDTLEITRKIKKVVDICGESSLFEILDNLYNEFDIYAKIPMVGDCSSGYHKCDTFLSFAKDMDNLGYGVEDMYAFFEEITNSDFDMSFADSSNPENAVTLINIHKSKGLEYPIIYFPLLDKPFNRTLKNSSFIVDQKFGISFPIVGRNTFDSLFQHKVKENDANEDFEEKLRLFYVALTRAREKIVMIINKAKLEKECPEISKAKSFVNILSCTSYGKYLKEYETTDEKLVVDNNKKEEQEIEFKEVHVDANELVYKKASKQKTVDVDEAVLDFGTKVHYALELLDYKTKDLSYIKDRKIKQYVENVVSSFVFENIDNCKILHEYRFFDEVSGVNGIIDCLIIREDEIDIIDFKLKNITDSHYDEQLNIYADYVKKISKLHIKKYLISAITGEVREIE